MKKKNGEGVISMGQSGKGKQDIFYFGPCVLNDLCIDYHRMYYCYAVLYLPFKTVENKQNETWQYDLLDTPGNLKCKQIYWSK